MSHQPSKSDEEKFDFKAIREYWGLHVGPKSSQHMQEKVLFKIYKKLTETKDAEREKAVEEERERKHTIEVLDSGATMTVDGKYRFYGF